MRKLLFERCAVSAATIVVLMAANACSRAKQVSEDQVLDKDGWNENVYQALNTLIAENADKGNYAVFDFDKTTITHDISNAVMIYQIENLRFDDAVRSDFLNGISEVDEQLKDLDISSAEMGQALKKEYEEMKAMLDAGQSMDEVRQTETYLDYRARFISFLEALDQTFPKEVLYAWMPGLLNGFTEEEAKDVISDAIDDQMGEDKLCVEEWRSPDGRWGGTVEKGIFLPQETRDLYRTLAANDIDAYVCSASLELIVEGLACDSLRGLGLPPERVFGLRFVEADTVCTEYDPTYQQPMFTGKVDCIKAYIAPYYDGRDPILVGGDSNGDVAMLTAFPDMQRGLIVDVGRSKESPIGQLAEEARKEDNGGRYLLQPTFAKIQGKTESGGI
ncbi:MAG: haloacid dehalogenase-like hydrolase [Bacteroidaceae bacterium]|nr:haloacid dehalogenase-like hydrolase [Bacteroidaceae bacterium]